MVKRRASVHDIEYVGFVTGDGGDANQMLLLARGAQALGRRVRIVVPRSDTTAAFAARARGYGIDCDRSSLLQADASGPRQSFSSMIRLVRSLRAPIVHFHTGNSCLPRSLMVALRLGRVNNCVVTLHSPYETIDIGSTRARWWASSSRRSFSAVVSPSEHGSRFQRNCGVNAEQVVTIRNAIDPTAIEAANADRVRSEMKMTGGEPMIVFTSRIEPQKRPVDAVRIFAGVSDEFPDARLVFVGSGSARDAVAAAAEQLGLLDRVMLVGLRSDVPDWLAAATVWLLPTERENFSVAVLEALAAGCPILTTNCPGNDEVIVNGENAISFEPGDVPAATDGLRRLILDATFRQRLSRGAVKSSRDYFMDTMVDQYLALYEHAEPSR